MAHCPDIEHVSTSEHLISALPTSLLRLTLEIRDGLEYNNISRLTRLEKLFAVGEEGFGIDLTPIPWLKTLEVKSMAITGIHLATQLTRLTIMCHEGHKREVLQSLTALVRLERLELDLSEDYSYDGFYLAGSNLTQLELGCGRAVLNTLSTTLQHLRLQLHTPHNYADITHLTNLTSLGIVNFDDANSTGYERISSLTNLEWLMISNDDWQDQNIISLSTLRHLTHLRAFKVGVDSRTIQCLTNLHDLQVKGAPFDQESWDSLSRSTRLTSLCILTGRGHNDAGPLDLAAIAALPLEILRIQLPHSESSTCMSHVLKLTSLAELALEHGVGDADLARLTALNRLTSLKLAGKNSERVSGECLTNLTSLQKIILSFQPIFTAGQLEACLTRLRFFSYWR